MPMKKKYYAIPLLCAVSTIFSQEAVCRNDIKSSDQDISKQFLSTFLSDKDGQNSDHNFGMIKFD